MGAVPGRVERNRRLASPLKRFVVATVLTELILIVAGCNQWVTTKVTHYFERGPTGTLQRIAASSETFSWRVSKASGQDTSEWLASFVRSAVVLLLSALLVGFIARRGSFWRAAVATLVAVVFATEVGAVVDVLIAPGKLAASAGLSGGFGGTSTVSSGIPIRRSDAVFGFAGPTGFRFVGGVILGVIVAIVVGLVARRLGDGEQATRSFSAPTPQSPPQTFFPPGDLQRGFDAALGAQLPPPAPLASPGSFALRDDDEGGGRHSRG